MILYHSIAICLGIKKVCKKSFEWLSKHQVLSEVVTDKEAVSACLQMAGMYTSLS